MTGAQMRPMRSRMVGATNFGSGASTTTFAIGSSAAGTVGGGGALEGMVSGGSWAIARPEKRPHAASRRKAPQMRMRPRTGMPARVPLTWIATIRVYVRRHPAARVLQCSLPRDNRYTRGPLQPRSRPGNVKLMGWRIWIIFVLLG